MNYYAHHMGDYAKDTAHLSLLEDGAYRRIMDLYYSSERPLPLDRAKLYRLLRAMSKQERGAVDVVVAEFFTECEDGWHQKRCDAEIEKAQEKSRKAADSADKRWHDKRDTNGSPNAPPGAMPTHSEGNAPNSQEPRASNQGKSKTMSGKPDAAPLNGKKNDALEVLEFLNSRTGRHYQAVEANMKLIRARIKEGATVDDCRAVIASRFRKWHGDPKMDEYLRPATLFNAEKFAQYRGELADGTP